MEVRKRVNELYDFVKDKHNVHTKIKLLVTSIKSAVKAAEREHDTLKSRAESAEKTLKEAVGHAAEHTAAAAQQTPMSPRNTRTEKRVRDSPGEHEAPKKQRNVQDCASVLEEGVKNGDWQTVESQREKREKQERHVEKKKEQKKKEKRRSPRKRLKGDALIVEVSDKTTYAAILRKVREDPELKDLGEKVVRTRRTQKGELLFELKKDPMIRSSAFRELIANSLGSEGNVRALTQEAVVECRDLDEITTVDELRDALASQCALGEVQMTIRLRRAYGGTQIAAIRLPVEAANKMVEVGKVKVGWSVCPLRLTPRIKKQMERCFKCMAFGHQARNCKGPDRSGLCRKCGEEGHVARDCTKQPRCLLCKPEDGNDHATGGFQCPAYKKAMAGQD